MTWWCLLAIGIRRTLEKKLSDYAKTLDERNRCVIHFDLDYYNG